MSDPQIVVNKMIEAWCAKDFEAVISCFHEDACYHNMPLAPVHGLAAIRATLEPFLTASKEQDWVIHNTMSNGVDLVMNERTDRFRLESGWTELPVAGVFQVRNGKISHWRDYFDMSGLAATMGGQTAQP